MKEHFKQLCENCGKVISQCRCMDCNKSITYGLCDKCKDVKDKLSKPEKKKTESVGGIVYATYNSYNACCDQWQAFHDQEMQRVADDLQMYKDSNARWINAYLNEYEVAEFKFKQMHDKVKQLERQIKDLEAEVCKGQIQAIRAETLERKVKDLEVKCEDLSDLVCARDCYIEDLQKQIKESREVSADEIGNEINKWLHRHNIQHMNYTALKIAIFNLINGDKKGE